MTGMILLLISVALVNNVVLSQFLGLCPFLGVSKKIGWCCHLCYVNCFDSNKPTL